MILLISLANDSVTDAICNYLSCENKNFIRLSEDQTIDTLFFDFQQNRFLISTSNIEFDLQDITSVFYRNGNITFQNFLWDLDENMEKFFFSEYKSIADFISYFLEKSGAKIYGNFRVKEVNKLKVLHFTKQLGFKIPGSQIFSSPKDLECIESSDRRYITKAISEMQPVFVDDTLYLNYTRDILMEEILEKEQRIIPTLLQEKIHKEYEIRVFFFDEKIWAIVTFDLSGNTDVRNMKTSDKKYIPYKLPSFVNEKIIALKNELGLNCGTIDFLKTKNDYYFLEINPVGQFGMVSKPCNYYLEEQMSLYILKNHEKK